MNLKLKKYIKVLDLAKKNKITKFELITNYGLFSGDTNLFKTLTIYEVLKKIENVKGDIIELGIHKGNTSLLIKKIIDIFGIKKKIYLLDHFKGLIHYGPKDTKASKIHLGACHGEKKQIQSFINFFDFKNMSFIDKDATTLKEGFFGKKKFAFAYFDMDLYLPTLKGLEAIHKNMSKGGLIVFDEGNKKLWSERFAIRDFLKKNRSKYKKITLSKKYAPDVVLQRI